MDKTLISNKDKKLFTKYLIKQDYREVATETPYKEGTVYEIATQKRKVSKDTIIVYQCLRRKLYERMLETRKEINNNLKNYKKND